MDLATIGAASTIVAFISGILKLGNRFVKFFSKIFAKKKNVLYLGCDRYGDKFYMINGKVENVTSLQEHRKSPMADPSFLFQKTSSELQPPPEDPKFQEEFDDVPQLPPEDPLKLQQEFATLSLPYEISTGFAEANNTLKAWWITLQADKTAAYSERSLLFEKALKTLSGCYKIWFHYLKESIEEALKSSVLSRRYQNVNNLFERALCFLHKMPRIWLMYCEFLVKQRKITKTRETFDRALGSLPATQHEKIWGVYHDWALKLESVPSAKSIIKRYLKINPDYKENYLSYLMEKEEFNESALILKEILEDDGYTSNSGKSKYQFLMQLCELIAAHPEKITGLDCEAVIQHGISKYTDEIGNLWVCLADYFIRQGLFEKARDVFDDALANILTARDFGIVFNAYVKFEEEIINMISQEDGDSSSTRVLNPTNEKDLRMTVNKILNLEEKDQDSLVLTEDYELDYRIERLEKLLDKRPLYLNDCLLRQNKNNIKEWIRRLSLVSKDERLYLKTISEALNQIDPEKAENGSFSEIWVKFASYYQAKNEFKSLNIAFEKASNVTYKTIDDLVNVWISWAEMLVEGGYTKDALLVLKQALFSKKKPGHISEHLSTALPIWCLYLDLEKNLGTFETINEAYKRMMNLKVITPVILLNYADFLEENKYFEESFKVFETGLNLFTWPSLYEIWLVYLEKFVMRYQGDYIERTRDLFEKALEMIPKEFSRIFYLMFADFEEKFGLLNHAIEIYDQLVRKVPEKDQKECYQIYISKVSEFLGVTKTRAIFESALGVLKGDDLLELGVKFAELEKKLGEIDRVRAIYLHVSQFCDPNYDKLGFWKLWEGFELRHGNIDTFKEFKKVWRSVLGKYALSPPDVSKIVEQVQKSIEKQEN